MILFGLTMQAEDAPQRTNFADFARALVAGLDRLRPALLTRATAG